MLTKKDFIIGYAPTRRSVFSKEEAVKYKNIIKEKIKNPEYKLIDIEDVAQDGLLVTENDLSKVIKKFKDRKVDAIFAPHCNFGTESSTAKLAQSIKKPFLLWGPRDEAPLTDGTRLRDTQCGLFATTKILQRLNVPYSYIINSKITDKIFERGFENFIKAANVVKLFKKIRIGQRGVRPRDFWTVICNEGELLEKFNIEIIPFNLGDIVSMAKDMIENPNDDFKDTFEFVKKNIKLNITDDELKNIIGLKSVLKQISKIEKINAFAIQCWTSLQSMLGILPCLSNSLLFDELIPVACETDINGAVSSLIAQAATFYEKPVFFADITIRHPEDDNAELLWHCGPFPYSMKKNSSKSDVGYNFILENKPAGVCNWEIKGGDISVIRFDGIKGKYSLFSGQAIGTNGPSTKGTYLWIKVKDWTRWEEKLIYGPYIHHVAGIHAKISPVLYEALRYIKHLEFDACEPGLEEIKDWLFCRE